MRECAISHGRRTSERANSNGDGGMGGMGGDAGGSEEQPRIKRSVGSDDRHLLAIVMIIMIHGEGE